MPIINLNYVYWDAVKQAKVVGWPLPTSTQPLYAYQRIAKAAPEYKQAGFEAALFQPSTLGAAGEYSSGYDLKDNYILDGTSWGSGAMGKAAVQALHAQGMKVYGDLVLHQCDGYPNQRYNTAKFPKTPPCFARLTGVKSYPGNVWPDSVPDIEGNYPDGDLCAYDQPNRYMWNGAIDAAIWLTQQMGLDGYRIDEAKGLHGPFVQALVRALIKAFPQKDLFFFGEYFAGNNAALGGWVNYWMDRLASVLDFGFKFNIGAICNNNSNSWMGKLSEIGYCMQDSIKAVTFCENADTDTTPGEQTIWNKQLGYDAMFTLPGEPMVYYRDWSTDPNCYGMKARINNGLWRWKNLAQGTFVTRNAEFQTFACERMGYGSAPGVVALFNNDQWAEHTIKVQTRYSPGTRLHEYSGNAGYSADLWADWQGCITRTIPRNVNGCNSLFYAPYI